jgi:DnaK suppressor protein
MATKTKAAAKTPAGHKAPAKAAPKGASKTVAGAKATLKPAAKPAAKPVAKAAAKAAPKKPARPVAAPARSPAKTLPPSKGAKAPAAKASESGKSNTAKSSTKLTSKESNPASQPVASAGAALSPLPPPKPPVRTMQIVSPKDLASAHEYLLTRSASRSGEAVIVDGKPLLTEEQLLAMPESEYMNAEQLAFFRHRLQEMERELLSNADETTEHLRETVIVPDPADRATIEEEHALELRTRDRERKLLKKVQGSLAQIEAGEYGYCEETGDPIGIPRLLARPTATLSLEAQQRREIKQKLFGD